MISTSVAPRLLRACGRAAAILALVAPLALPDMVHAQEDRRPMVAGVFDANAVRSLISRGDAAAAAGNTQEARRLYDQARDAAKRLLMFYRDLSGAFRGLDARIPREMDDKGRQTLDVLVEANMRLAALFRRQGQPEVAVPLLVEVITTMTPSSEAGRKAYQQLREMGFVTTPYNVPTTSN